MRKNQHTLHTHIPTSQMKENLSLTDIYKIYNYTYTQMTQPHIHTH